LNSHLGALPFPPLHFTLPPLSLFFPSPAPPPDAKRPEIQLGVWGSAVSSPSGVWVGAQAPRCVALKTV